jgi:hypothetical protein
MTAVIQVKVSLRAYHYKRGLTDCYRAIVGTWFSMLNGVVFSEQNPFFGSGKKFKIELDFAWSLKGSENSTQI